MGTQARRSLKIAENPSSPLSKGLPDDVQQRLASATPDLFACIGSIGDVVTRVRLGVPSAQSWLNDWPVKDEPPTPMLFDRDGKSSGISGCIETARIELSCRNAMRLDGAVTLNNQICSGVRQFRS